MSSYSYSLHNLLAIVYFRNSPLILLVTFVDIQCKPLHSQITLGGVFFFNILFLKFHNYIRSLNCATSVIFAVSGIPQMFAISPRTSFLSTSVDYISETLKLAD